MKIILTPKELIQLVASRYEIPVDGLSVTVAEDPDQYKAMADKLVLLQYQAGNLDDTGNVRPDKKIAAIKLLRETISGVGLAQAKSAVENWDRFIRVVGTKGIPSLASDWTF